jgi:hypothetical protein
MHAIFQEVDEESAELAVPPGTGNIPSVQVRLDTWVARF